MSFKKSVSGNPVGKQRKNRYGDVARNGRRVVVKVLMDICQDNLSPSSSRVETARILLAGTQSYKAAIGGEFCKFEDN